MGQEVFEEEFKQARPESIKEQEAWETEDINHHEPTFLDIQAFTREVI